MMSLLEHLQMKIFLFTQCWHCVFDGNLETELFHFLICKQQNVFNFQGKLFFLKIEGKHKRFFSSSHKFQFPACLRITKDADPWWQSTAGIEQTVTLTHSSLLNTLPSFFPSFLIFPQQAPKVLIEDLWRMITFLKSGAGGRCHQDFFIYCTQ